MSFASDLRILYHMVVRPIRGADHAARMESFYAGQADAYDSFRQRLLHGREEMFRAIDLPEGGTWVDLGSGTASNLELVADQIDQLDQVYVVDLSKSLLDIARDRIEQRQWTNVQLVEADATGFRPPNTTVDVVTFSYSLTMIPDWFAAIENARQMLKPGGVIAVVDFYVSRKYPATRHVRHGWFNRAFWPVWMSRDNVFTSSEHVPYLYRNFTPVSFTEKRGRVPYLPLLRAPYYIFVGRRA